jgi:hypothetical protein
MDIQRLGGVPFESVGPEPEPTKAGEARPAPPLSRNPDQISVTPMPLPGPGPVINPVPERGEAHPVRFLDTRLEIAAVKDNLLGHIGGPIVGQGVPTPGPRPGPDPRSGGIVFNPGLRAEQDVPPNPNPEPDPGPDPIPEPDRRFIGQLLEGGGLEGLGPKPSPRPGPEPGPAGIVFGPGLRAEQDVPPAPPDQPPPPPPDDPEPTPPNPEAGRFGQAQWSGVQGGIGPMPGPKGGPDPVPDGPGSKPSLEGVVVLGHGLRAEQDVPPGPAPEPSPPPDPDPTPPNPDGNLLNGKFGKGPLKG